MIKLRCSALDEAANPYDALVLGIDWLLNEGMAFASLRFVFFVLTVP